MEKSPINNKGLSPENNTIHLEEVRKRILAKKTYITRSCEQLAFNAGRVDAAPVVANIVLEKALRNAAQFDQRGTLNTWLGAITKNAFTDYLRSIKTEPIEDKGTIGLDKYGDIVDPSANIEEILIEKEEAKLRVKKLWEAIERLPDHEKEALTLNLGGVNDGKIAEELNIPVGTAKTHLSRARRRVAKELGQPDHFILKRGPQKE